MPNSSAQIDFDSLRQRAWLLILARRGNHSPRLPGRYAVDPVTGQRIAPPVVDLSAKVRHPGREVYTQPLADLLLAVLTHTLQRYQGRVIAHGCTRAFFAAVFICEYPGPTLHQSVERVARKRAGNAGLATKNVRLCTSRPHYHEISPEVVPALVACVQSLKIET